jgi:predicted MFS family arabinose efflux permease
MPPILEISAAQVAPLTVRNVIHEIGDGFAFVWRLKVLRWLLIAMSIANLGGVGLRTLMLYVLREEHHLDEVTIGLALSISGGLTIIGSLLAPRLARDRPMGHSMIAVILASGLAALAGAFTSDWRLITLCFTGREIAWQAFIIYAFIPRQRDVPANLRGRANGAFRTVVLISNSASPAVLSAIVVVASSAVAFAVAGALSVASAAVATFSPLRDYAVREPAADEVTRATTGDETVAASGK